VENNPTTRLRQGTWKKKGTRKHDVKPETETLKNRLLDFPDQFFQVLCTVLTPTQVPNSFPRKCLFRTFNVTYNDDQKSSYTDYIGLDMQTQFNKRDL
jgi:hypothetical protein